jgi:hypothetical protein
MTDEAHFDLSGCVNEENLRCLAEENPQKLHQRPLRIAHMTVWYGIKTYEVTCSYFIEEEVGRAVTVTPARYVEMLRNFPTPELSSQPYGSSKMAQLPIERDHPWRSLGKYFPEHVILLRGELPWPARSPDLSVSD